MKLFGIIENTLVFEDRYSMPVIHVDVSDEDKDELLAQGANEFSDWAFVTTIEYCMSMNAWKEEYDKLKHRVDYNGDWKVLRILYEKIEGEKESWLMVWNKQYVDKLPEAEDDELPF